MIYVAVRQERSEIAQVLGAWAGPGPAIDSAKACCEADARRRGESLEQLGEWEWMHDLEGGEPEVLFRLGPWGWCYEVWVCPADAPAPGPRAGPGHCRAGHPVRGLPLDNCGQVWCVPCGCWVTPKP